jgi:hypothetical protein
VPPAPPPPPPPPAAIELLHAVRAIVAVSSTVANASIKPEHLVDGDLTTAWNSKTGDLDDAWIAFRVPAETHVTAIRMTCGFTVADKRGDLFTMNPRVTKVRVSRAGKQLAEQALDPTRRTLQDIPLDAPGGDFTIEILAVQPGSKASWREVNVSELQVMGTLAAGQTATAQKPLVRVGSLDAQLAPGFDECQKLVYPAAHGGRISADPDAEWITSWNALGLGRDLALCRIEHRAQGSEDTGIELAVVQHGKAWSVVGRESFTATKHVGGDAEMGAQNETTVTAEPFVLTTGETAVLVAQTSTGSGPMSFSSHTAWSLRRVSPAGFSEVLAFESNVTDGESSDKDVCKLWPVDAPTAKLPVLQVDCTHTEGRWHHEDPRGDGEFVTQQATRYKWNGTRYVEAGKGKPRDLP